MSAVRCIPRSTVTLDRALPIASPVTWFTQARTTWLQGRFQATGERTVLHSSCSSSCSTARASRSAGSPPPVQPDRCTRSLSTRCSHLDQDCEQPRQLRGGSASRTQRGCLPPASISPSSFLSISSSSAARTDGERTGEGGRP